MTDGEKNKDVWAEKEHASALMSTVLSHYASHRSLVLKKLELAQQASMKHRKKAALENAGSWLEKIKIFIGTARSADNKNGELIWGEIRALFAQKTILEDDLFYIEEMLEKMPENIKIHYNRLLKKNRQANKIKKRMNRGAYTDAKKRISAVQNIPNPLNGMTAQEYEDNFFNQLKSMIFAE